MLPVTVLSLSFIHGNCFHKLFLVLFTLSRHPAVAGLKEESKQNLPAVMAFGHGLPALVHYENTHFVSAHSDFSRADMQTMPFLHPSRPDVLDPHT
jgi:hypothetical protein